ncbi:MAG: gamma-glutamyltransferase, partial [Pirellulaceae bacterium]|nr:gamma-glutamyltransferase [Pirellulaceae bacterium]
DAEGNMVSATPSGGWITTSPVIPGLGMCLGTRGQMFYLNPQRPNALAGRKRPRTTLTPSLVTRDGRPLMAFGTPGGDLQDQLTLQFFINVTDFGMDLQEAIDAPTVYSQHFPSSFFPRNAFPGQATVEGRIDRQTISELEQRGHQIVVNDDWAHGRVQAIGINHCTGFIHGAVSPRGSMASAMAW